VLAFQTRGRAIADALRRRIAAGEIAPGSQLRQLDIAGEFGVSTTPVREAFAALRRDGLLVLDAQKRLIVFEPTIDEIVEIYEIRRRLEGLATRRAVPKLTSSDIAELESIYTDLGELTGTEYVDRNRDLHQRLYRCSEMPQLLRQIDALQSASVAYLSLLSSEPAPDTVTPAQQEHRAILDRCREGDVEGACSAMDEHLRSTQASIRELLIRA
jgi:DNA-binding GntR family transcriptional regulator